MTIYTSYIQHYCYHNQSLIHMYMYNYIGKLKDARRDLNTVIKIHPNDPDAKQKLKACEKAIREGSVMLCYIRIILYFTIHAICYSYCALNTSYYTSFTYIDTQLIHYTLHYRCL